MFEFRSDAYTVIVEHYTNHAIVISVASKVLDLWFKNIVHGRTYLISDVQCLLDVPWPAKYL